MNNIGSFGHLIVEFDDDPRVIKAEACLPRGQPRNGAANDSCEPLSTKGNVRKGNLSTCQQLLHNSISQGGQFFRGYSSSVNIYLAQHVIFQNTCLTLPAGLHNRKTRSCSFSDTRNVFLSWMVAFWQPCSNMLQESTNLSAGPHVPQCTPCHLDLNKSIHAVFAHHDNVSHIFKAGLSI